MAARFMTTPEGNRVGVSSYGDPVADRLVVLCHPTPGAPMDPEPTVTARWGVHIVAIERPGYGSTPPSGAGGNRMEHRAGEVDALIQSVERNADAISNARLTRYGVIGWGTGGVLAAAIAARDPDRVDRLALVDVPAPTKAARMAREAAGRPITAASLGLTQDDTDLGRHVGLWNRVKRMLDDARLQGDSGVRSDVDLLSDTTWTERLDRIAASTILWLGDRDPFVDESDVRWWGTRIRGAVAHRVRDSGPLTIAASWSRVLTHVAPEHGSIEESERDHESVLIADVDPVQPERG